MLFRSHIRVSILPQAPLPPRLPHNIEQNSLCSRAQEPQLLKPTWPRVPAVQQEKPPQREVHAPQLKKSPHSNEDPAQPKINKQNYFFKMDNNKHVPYSTGNSARRSMAAWMGGELGGERIHVYAWLSPFAVHLKLSPHC